MQITKNEFKQASKLKQKKYRRLENSVLIEGKRLIDQIMANGLTPEKIFYQQDTANPYPHLPHAELSEEQLRKLSFTQNPQKVMAILPTKSPAIEKRRLLLYLDGVSEPGNLGTIFRTATAAKVDGIVLSDDCCDIWNDKAIRASLGTIFSMPSEIKPQSWLSEQDAHVVSSSLQDSHDLFSSKLSDKNQILVIGSEAFGISKTAIEASDELIKIPMLDQVESLNVAVATGIIIFHYSQQI